MTTATTYTTDQVMFTLAYLTASDDLFPGIDPPLAERILLGKFRSELASLAPVANQWSIVWGPTVYRFPWTILPDNVWYVARNNASPDQYVIGIRGTDPYAFADWLFEDFMIDPKDMLPWPFGSPPAGALISQGTSTGLTALLGTAPSPGIPGDQQKLPAFLAGAVAASGPINLTVAGHSLGGLLSSTLALALADTEQAGAAPWDPSGKSTVTCYSFAGPTAGNAAFATYTDQRIGASLHRYYNTLDIAPHAWSWLALAELPFMYLYPLDIKPTSIEIAAIALTMGVVKDAGYQQPSTGGQALPGKANPADTTYVGQAAYQHSQGYVNALGLSSVFPPGNTTAQLATARDRRLTAFRVNLVRQADPRTK